MLFRNSFPVLQCSPGGQHSRKPTIPNGQFTEKAKAGLPFQGAPPAGPRVSPFEHAQRLASPWPRQPPGPARRCPAERGPAGRVERRRCGPRVWRGAGRPSLGSGWLGPGPTGPAEFVLRAGRALRVSCLWGQTRMV